MATLGKTMTIMNLLYPLCRVKATLSQLRLNNKKPRNGRDILRRKCQKMVMKTVKIWRLSITAATETAIITSQVCLIQIKMELQPLDLSNPLITKVCKIILGLAMLTTQM